MVRRTSRLLGILFLTGFSLLLGGRAAEAKFTEYVKCLRLCKDQPDLTLQIAWTLDCGLELTKCIKDVLPLPRLLPYLPTIDPRDVAGIAQGSLVSADLLLLDTSPGYMFGSSNDFDTLLVGNTFIGPTGITGVEIRALSIDVFESIAAAADVALDAGDPSVGLQNPLWNTAQVLFSGSPSGIVLNTNLLSSPGDYILRIQVTDSTNGGTIYGLGSLSTPVPEPSTLLMTGVALGLIGSSRRRKKGA